MIFFNTLLFDPLYNFLIGTYIVLPDMWKDLGLAIVIVTVVIKAILAPIFRKQIESQKKLQELQPKIKEIQKKYKDNKERQTKAVMEFYKEHGVNPFAGCLPLILQLVIFIAIYRVIIRLIEDHFSVDAGILYSFISSPQILPTQSFGVIDLSAPNYTIAILAAGAMYYQSKMMMNRNNTAGDKKTKKDDAQPDFSQMMMKQMLYIGPAITLIIGFKFAAGLTLYWLASIVFSIVQQYIIQHRSQKNA